MINISRARATDGWMSDFELTWLAERAQTHRVIVEIGSYLGKSTRALADHTPGIVYAVDHWNGPREVDLPEEERASLYGRFASNMQDLILSGKIVPIVCDHGDFPALPDLAPDMVFIDGSHDYQSVKRDILFWKDRLRPSGLLCGHDFNLFRDVKRAVEELLPGAKAVPHTDIWENSNG